MQPGLLGKRFQRLRERLRGNRGGDGRGCIGLRTRGADISESKRHADEERTQQPRPQGRDLCR